MKEAIKENAKLGDDEVSLVVVAHKATRAGCNGRGAYLQRSTKPAVPVGKGEIIALDENDVMAIVTRHLVEDDKTFGDDRIKFHRRTIWPWMRPKLTTIGNLYDVLKVVFVKCGSAKNVQELQTIRPSDKAIDDYIDLAKRFFDGLASQFKELNESISAQARRRRRRSLRNAVSEGRSHSVQAHRDAAVRRSDGRDREERGRFEEGAEARRSVADRFVKGTIPRRSLASDRQHARWWSRRLPPTPSSTCSSWRSAQKS